MHCHFLWTDVGVTITYHPLAPHHPDLTPQRVLSSSETNSVKQYTFQLLLLLA